MFIFTILMYQQKSFSFSGLSDARQGTFGVTFREVILESLLILLWLVNLGNAYFIPVHQKNKSESENNLVCHLLQSRMQSRDTESITNYFGFTSLLTSHTSVPCKSITDYFGFTSLLTSHTSVPCKSMTHFYLTSLITSHTCVS